MGLAAQLKRGVLADGSWYEGSWSYHLYTLSALTPLLEAAYHCNLPSYELADEAYKRMLLVMVNMAMPDGGLPATNDSHPASLAAAQRFFEVGFARYGAVEFAAALEVLPARSTLEGLLVGEPILPQAALSDLGSMNLQASGAALFRQTSEAAGPVYVMLDYGPHGGGHGHPDKLDVVVYGEGRLLVPDPGCASYGVPVHQGWYRQTLAHNTLVVDETSQSPAQGKCLGYVASPEVALELAASGGAYSEGTLYRCVALVEGRFLLVMDRLASGEPHRFDWAWHQYGTPKAPPEAHEWQPPDKPGYKYLEEARLWLQAERVLLDWPVESGGKRFPNTLFILPGRTAEVVLAKGPGVRPEERIPCLLVRTHGKNALYGAALALALESATVQPSGNLIIPEGTNEAFACYFKLAGGRYLLLANPEGASVKVAELETDARAALVVSGAEPTLVLAEATHFSYQKAHGVAQARRNLGCRLGKQRCTPVEGNTTKGWCFKWS